MEFINYDLKIGTKNLINNLNLSFEKNVFNHLLGSNGCGKSTFAKSCVGMLKHGGQIIGNENIILLGSSSNVPSTFNIKDILKLLCNKFDEKQVKEIYELLRLNEVSKNLPIKKMSDGQKQKIKLLSFLSSKPKVIFLDEFTNTLDKKSSLDLYDFFQDYITKEDITFVNITHNLSDIEYLEGNYYYLHDKTIEKLSTKEMVIDAYIKG